MSDAGPRPVDPRLVAGYAARPAPPATAAADFDRRRDGDADPRKDTDSAAGTDPTPDGDPAAAADPAADGGSEADADPDSPAGGDAEPAQRPRPTGHPRVDAALDELARAQGKEPDQQIAAYESVHRTLQETMGTIEQS